MPDAQQLALETTSALQAEWDLQISDLLSEAEIIQLLAQRIADILQKGPETFFQLMYRLDISEKKLNAVFGNEDTAQEIARLVYNRQLQKIKSRQEHRQKSEHTDPDLEW